VHPQPIGGQLIECDDLLVEQLDAL